MVAGQGIRRTGDHQECLVIVLEGHASIVVGGREMGVLGSRESVFDGPPPPLVLAAPGLSINVEATTDSLIVIAAAPGGLIERTASIDPAEIVVESRGVGGTARKIHHLLPPNAGAGRLICFEAFTPGGNWSSYPPHKHDTEDPPTEAYLEEVYLFRFARPGGFAMQRVYAPNRSIDVSLAPADLDMVLVPEGYHVVAAAPGYDCYYLNLMAGPNRAWHFTVDPDHAWLMDWDPTAPRTG
jgi:5-deoxy-glucuronate isomerase